MPEIYLKDYEEFIIFKSKYHEALKNKKKFIWDEKEFELDDIANLIDQIDDIYKNPTNRFSIANLAERYKLAISKNEETFVWNGNDINVEFAKYLLEYYGVNV